MSLESLLLLPIVVSLSEFLLCPRNYDSPSVSAIRNFAEPDKAAMSWTNFSSSFQRLFFAMCSYRLRKVSTQEVPSYRSMLTLSVSTMTSSSCSWRNRVTLVSAAPMSSQNLNAICSCPFCCVLHVFTFFSTFIKIVTLETLAAVIVFFTSVIVTATWWIIPSDDGGGDPCRRHVWPVSVLCRWCSPWSDTWIPSRFWCLVGTYMQNKLKRL